MRATSPWLLLALAVTHLACARPPEPAIPSTGPDDTRITIVDQAGAPYDIDTATVAIDGDIAFRWDRRIGHAAPPSLALGLPHGDHVIDILVEVRVPCGIAGDTWDTYTLREKKPVRVAATPARLSIVLVADGVVKPHEDRLRLVYRSDRVVLDPPAPQRTPGDEACWTLPATERSLCRLARAVESARTDRDVVRLSCANEKHARAKALVDAAPQPGSDELVRQLAALAAQADDCGGAGPAYFGSATVTRTWVCGEDDRDRIAGFAGPAAMPDGRVGPMIPSGAPWHTR